ncbi:MAG: glycosyltransferase [Bacteroidota bacterium]|nr:glycosyltransferase [Bacteroidota bacterium]
MHNIISLSNLHWVLGEQELGPLELYFSKALRSNGKEVSFINIHTLYSNEWKKLSGYSHRFPRKFDNTITMKYFKLINDSLIKKYNTDKPSHIFIYNDCKVLPDTIEYFKSNGTRIIVFLGDDPNYLFPAKKTFLLTVMKADAVILPDTGWIDGLKMLDINKIIYSPYGTDPEIFFPVQPTREQKELYTADILFIGTAYYLNTWGIRRAAMLNELSGMDFKLFGDKTWNDLFPFFPELSNHYTNKPLYSKEVNEACSCCKLYPVIVNSGVINGASTRIFDCIASGIFILAEYRKDLDTLFTDGEVVTFKSKKELKEKALYFLKNDAERNDHAEFSRKKVLEKYTLDISVKNILEQI